jgi:alcohol dehydrogenase class IV
MIDLHLPKRIICHNGSLSHLGELGADLGDHALVCTGRTSLEASGMLAKALHCLDGHAVQTSHFSAIDHDPSLSTVDAAVDFARETDCDFIVAIGGGSVLDAGKAVAAILPQEGHTRPYFDGERAIEQHPLPIIAIPTTAGTGSECTNNAVLTDTEHKTKKSLRDPRMIPELALVDPELTISCPPDLTARCGMDALTQAIECFVSIGANPATDALILSAIEQIARHLPGAVAEGDNMDHREPVAIGSLMAAMAFGNAGLGAVHGLAHPLGAQFGIPHGLACAILLPHVCAFNMEAREEKFAHIAPLLGAATAHDVPEALLGLNRDLGIPDTLADYAVTPSDIPAIIADSRSGSMAKNPRPASDDDLAHILNQII